MKVLVACEFSATVRDAFRARGHDAWSCDILQTEGDPRWHFQGDAIRATRFMRWDLIICHPPCTYLLRAGWHWVNRPDCDVEPLKGNPRRIATRKAAEFFMELLNSPAERVAIENPVPISHAKLPPYTQTIQPWQFGHGETKATCLWLKNLPPLERTHRENDFFCAPEPKERIGRIHMMSPGPNRSKERSRTFPGIANAMAEQWGSLK